ncbi:Imm1 family immunity protein [Streptomyces bobili]|uniref:Imm1 family immunity protein n=1 Tax=Streptomyces bobili TaxID=67280 RepID=UPI0037175F19
MVLNVDIHGKREYAETDKEVSELIAEAVENLSFEQVDSPWVDPGEDAWFMWAERRLKGRERPDNHLRVAVNSSTGYGALLWFFNAERAERANDSVSDRIWVSNNPTPPNFDPRVVSDPGYPLFHDPISTIPVSEVRRALQEFCDTKTGDRPTCVEWTQAEMNGTRL